MNEHGWPGDHHDDDGGFAGHDHGDPLEPLDLDAPLPHDQDDVWDEPDPPPLEHHDPGHEPGPEPDQAPYEQHTDPAPEPDPVDADPHEMATVGADPDALPDTGDQAEVFPPAVDVGPLPEPVDGFPWIDTATLGRPGPAPVAAADTPDPGELAGYAAADLPPGADPWAALAASDDPATSALARFWGSAARPDQP